MGKYLDIYDKEVRSITDRRGDDYGHPLDDFKTVSELMKHFDDIRPVEVRHAIRMICVKLARLKTSPTLLDNWVDIAGYARTAAMVIDEASVRLTRNIEKADAESD